MAVAVTHLDEARWRVRWDWQGHEEEELDLAREVWRHESGKAKDTTHKHETDNALTKRDDET